MGYQYGASNIPAGAQIAQINRAIQSKQDTLARYETRVAELKKEDARLRESVRRNKLRTLTKQERQEARKRETAPWPKEQIIAAATPHYDKAMQLHPDNAVEGPKRMAAILNEAQNVQLTVIHGRAAGPKTHQEAA